MRRFRVPKHSFVVLVGEDSARLAAHFMLEMMTWKWSNIGSDDFLWVDTFSALREAVRDTVAYYDLRINRCLVLTRLHGVDKRDVQTLNGLIYARLSSDVETKTIITLRNLGDLSVLDADVAKAVVADATVIDVP